MPLVRAAIRACECDTLGLSTVGSAQEGKPSSPGGRRQWVLTGNGGVFPHKACGALSDTSGLSIDKMPLWITKQASGIVRNPGGGPLRRRYPRLLPAGLPRALTATGSMGYVVCTTSTVFEAFCLREQTTDRHSDHGFIAQRQPTRWTTPSPRYNCMQTSLFQRECTRNRGVRGDNKTLVCPPALMN